MGVIVKPYTFSAGATVIAAEHNINFDTVYTLVNGNLDNNNLSLSAGIVGSKLASLASITAGAGVIPNANLLFAPRVAASDPQHVTPGSRPSGTLYELVSYSGKLYFCTSASTPTWEKITSG